MAETVELTITIDAGTAARLTRLAEREGTSVSQLVEASLRHVPDENPPDEGGLREWEQELPPLTRELREVSYAARGLPQANSERPVDWKAVYRELRYNDYLRDRL